MAADLTKSLSIRITVIADIAKDLVGASDDIRFALKKPIQEATAQLENLKTSMAAMGAQTVKAPSAATAAARTTATDVSAASSKVMDRLVGKVERLTGTVKKLRDELKAVKDEARSVGTGGTTTGGAIGPTSRINEPAFQESKRIQENINLQTKLNNLMRSSGATRGSEFGIISNLAGIEGNVKKLESVLNKARALMQRGFTAKELGFGSTAEMEKTFKSAERIITQYGAKIRQVTSEQFKATWLPGTQAGKSASESAKVFNQIEKERTAEMAKQAKLRAGEVSSIKQQVKMYEQLRAVLSDPRFNAKELQKYVSMLQSGGTLKGSVPVWAKEIDDNFIKNFNRMKKDFPEFANTIDAMAQKTGVSLGKQYNAVQKYANSIRNFMKFQMEWFAGAGLIFGAIAALRRLISAGIDFEQTMHDVAAVTGLGYNELERFSAVAIETSKNSPLAATEVAKLGLQLLRAGLEADDATEAMRVASKVAVISGEDMKTVADTIATAMMAWKMSGTEAARVGNVIAIGMNKSRLTVEDLGTAFNYIAGVAKSLNITFEETNSVLAVLSNRGVRASTMATGWTQFMSSFIAPSKQLSTWLQRVGADMNKLDPTRISGPHKMVTMLNELKRIGFSTSEAFGMLEVRAGRFYQFLSTAGPEALLKMEAAMSDTKQLNEAYEKSMAGLKNTMKEMWNTLESGTVIAMTNFAPALRVITTLLKYLMIVVASLMAGLSQLPVQIALIVAGITILVAKLWLMRAELTKIIALSNLSGWGLIIKGIGALAVVTGVGALIDKQLSKSNQTTSEQIEGMTKYKGELDNAKNSAHGLANGIDDVGEGTKSAYTAAKMFKEEWARAAEPDITKALNVWDSYKEKVEAARKEMEKANKEAQDAADATNPLKNALRNIQDELNKEPDKKGWFSKLLEFLTDDKQHLQRFAAAKRLQMGELPEGPSLGSFKFNKQGVDWQRSGTFVENYWETALGVDRFTIKPQETKRTEAQIAALKNYTKVTSQRFEAWFEELSKAAKIKADLSLARTEADVKRIAEGAQKILGEEAFERQDLSREVVKALDEVNKKKNKIDESAFDRMLKRQKEEIEAVKLAGQERIEARAFEYEQAKLMDDEYYIKIEANLDREKASLEFYYSNELISAKEYFDKKKMLLDDSVGYEIQKAKDAAWYKEQSINDQIEAQQDLYEATNRALMEATATPAYTEAGIEKRNTALLDYQNKLKEITNTIKKLQDQKSLIDPELQNQLLKLTENAKTANEELERTERIALATEDITKRQQLLGIEKELLQVQIEANELAGNWGEAQKLSAIMAGIDKENALLTVRKQIVELETKRNEVLHEGKDYDKNIDLQIYAYEDLYEAVKKVKEEEERRKIAMSTYMGAIKLALEDSINQWKDYKKLIYDTTKEIANILQGTISSFLYDISSGDYQKNNAEIRSQIRENEKEMEKLKSQFDNGSISVDSYTQQISQLKEENNKLSDSYKTLIDYIEDFAKSVLKAIDDMVAEIIASKILDLLYQLANSGYGGGYGHGGKIVSSPGFVTVEHQGGLIMHSGGMVPELPRYHSGYLAPDERPAILQTGERVLSRSQNKEYEQKSQDVNVTVNVENQTGQPMDAKQGKASFDGENYIVNVILKNIDQYGSLRHAIAGVR